MAFCNVLLGLTLGGAVLAQQPPAPSPQPAATPAQATAPPGGPGTAPQPVPAPRPAVPPVGPGEEVLAPRSAPIAIPVNGSYRLRMSSAKRIRRVVNEKEAVARVTEVPGDPTSVLVTGLVPDTTRVTLTDEDGREETYAVVVQFDVEYLRTLLQKAVPTASVTPLPAANNFIILAGTVARADDVDVILKTAASVVGLDKVINAMRVGGVMQVQLDVVVASVNRSQARMFGFNLLVSGTSAIFGQTTGGLASVPTIGTVPPSAFNVNNVSGGSAIGTGGTTTGGGGGGGGSSGGTGMGTGLTTGGSISAPPGVANLFLGIATPGQSYLGFLEALKTEGLAKVLTQPKVVTLSGRPASIVSGQEVAVPQPQGLGTVGVSYKPIGTIVNFLPIVEGNGKIYLEVETEVSRIDDTAGTQLGNGGGFAHGFATQRERASVEIEDGQTLAIGGLIEHTVQANLTKTPVLGDLPFIGAAFSTKSFTDIEAELVIIVTPHLVDPMDCAQLPKLLPSQETRKPDDFELFLEGIAEAPRGPREVCPNGHYVAAYKNGPTAQRYPCAGTDKCGQDGCGPNGCGTANPAPLMAPPAQVLVPTGYDNRPMMPLPGAVRRMPAGAPETEGSRPTAALPETGAVQPAATTGPAATASPEAGPTTGDASPNASPPAETPANGGSASAKDGKPAILPPEFAGSNDSASPK